MFGNATITATQFKKSLKFSGADKAKVDWNQDGEFNLNFTETNISRIPFGTCEDDKTYEKLHSQNDWDSLVYNFRPVAGNRFKTAVEGIKEPSVEDRLAFLELIDTDEDGVSNRTDVCIVDSDPGQEDTDGDGVGDVCDDCPEDAAPYEENGCPEQDLDEKGNEFDASNDNTENQLPGDLMQKSSRDVPELVSAKTGGCNTIPNNQPPIGLIFIVLVGLFSITKRKSLQLLSYNIETLFSSEFLCTILKYEKLSLHHFTKHLRL